MTPQEFSSAYNKAAAAININIVSADTDLTHLAELCCYGGKYHRGISETFQSFAQECNHAAKTNIFIRELNAHGIKTQPTI